MLSQGTRVSLEHLISFYISASCKLEPDTRSLVNMAMGVV